MIVLSKANKLAENISSEYPFIKDNHKHMSADPGGMFRCLLVRAEGEQENMLIAQGRKSLYLAYEYPAKAPKLKKSRKRNEPER